MPRYIDEIILAIGEYNSINARMIERRIEAELLDLLDESPAVALLGPRQVGKTTLAINISETRTSIYLDLESEADRAKLSEPELYLASHSEKLVVLDEVHRLPSIFHILRGLIDRNAGPEGAAVSSCCLAPLPSISSSNPEKRWLAE
ncbi:hypothetical protein AGR6A_pAt50080 [Agrobacterium sp. NCPPB 925]|nr:hypothetical protein AGR6A_pAt50080 [Agrobacterium sp. NCPPB 925]